jgi:hypothetical protein
MKILNSIMAKNEVWNKFSNPSEIFRWLGNFEQDELLFALKLADNILYYNNNQIDYLFNLILNKQVKLCFLAEMPEGKELTDSYIWFQDYLKNKCVFIGYGKAGKSGPHMVYPFRNSQGIRGLSYLDLSELLHNPMESLKNLEVVFLIDDFIGSGDQAVTNWNSVSGSNSLQSISKEYSHIKFIYLVLAGFNEGKNKIESKTPMKVIIGDELDETCMCFSDNSIIFEDHMERANIRHVMAKRGKELSPRWPLGYNNMQSVVAFHHNTPNASLPVIWMKNVIKNWHPLFERKA